MELSLKYIVAAFVVVAVLVVLSLFITTSTTKEISKSDANLVFSTMCQDFGARGCLRPLDSSPDTTQFTSACKQIFGDETILSCLYIHCDSCKKIDAAEAECYVLCGDANWAPTRPNRCSLFASKCGESTISCPVCTGS